MKKFDEILKKGWLIGSLIVLAFGGAILDSLFFVKYAYEVGKYSAIALIPIVAYIVIKTWVNSARGK